MKIPVEQARRLAYDEVRQPDLPFDVVENRQIDSGRWTSIHELVIKDDSGELFRATYEQGLTENQDEGPFEYGPGDEVEFKPVRREVVESYKYVTA